MKISESDKKKVFEDIKKLIDAQKNIHSQNVSDFKMSKNYASGDSFSIESLGGIYSKDRGRVSSNYLFPAVNSINYMFSKDPFEFKTNADINAHELKFQLSAVLNEIMTDGLSYLLVVTDKSGKISFEKLNNFNVIYGDCKFPDGKDANEAIYIDKKRTNNKGYRRSPCAIAFPEKVLALAEDEIPVITYWRKSEAGVTTCKIEGDKITESVEQPFRRLPVIRFYGYPSQTVNFETTYRGIYKNVLMLLMKLDVENSIIYDNELCEDDFKYWRGEESIGVDASTRGRNDDGATKVWKTFREFPDPNSPELRASPPVRNQRYTELPGLIASAEYTKRTIGEIIGNVAGEIGGKQKTAEEILFMKDEKHAAANTFIENLLLGAYEISACITDITGHEVTITEGIIENLKKQDKLKKLFALIDYLNQKPEAMAILPVLLKNMDLSEDEEQMIIRQFAIRGEANPQLMAAQQQVQQLTAQLNTMNANVEAQVAAAKIRQTSELTKLQSDSKIKMLELQLKDRELTIKEVELGIKNKSVDNKMEVDAAKLTLETDKEIAKQLENIQQVEVPSAIL